MPEPTDATAREAALLAELALAAAREADLVDQVRSARATTRDTQRVVWLALRQLAPDGLLTLTPAELSAADWTRAELRRDFDPDGGLILHARLRPIPDEDPPHDDH